MFKVTTINLFLILLLIITSCTRKENYNYKLNQFKSILTNKQKELLEKDEFKKLKHILKEKYNILKVKYKQSLPLYDFTEEVDKSKKVKSLERHGIQLNLMK